MNTNTFNVRGLLNFLSNKYGEKCHVGFDIFLIQTLHRKIKFDWHIANAHRNQVIEMLFDSMEGRNYDDEEASRLAREISSLLISPKH